MRTIRIDDEVWQALQARAVPFADTPNSVLRRELGLDPRADVAGQDAEDVQMEAKGSEEEGTTMNFRRLMHFLNYEIRMRAIYQPWLIRYLILHGGESTVDGVSGDIPQPKGSPPYNRHLTPISVLGRHGIVEECAGGRLRLTTWPVSESEKVQVLTRCEDLIRTFERRRQWPK